MRQPGSSAGGAIVGGGLNGTLGAHFQVRPSCGSPRHVGGSRRDRLDYLAAASAGNVKCRLLSMYQRERFYEGVKQSYIAVPMRAVLRLYSTGERA